MTARGSEANQDGWRALGDWSTSPRMNELEGVMWRGERHPEFSSAGVVMEILETEPDWERFRSAFEWAAGAVTRLRQVVVEPVLPTGPPAWRVDDTFDLDEHLTRAQLPAPAGMAELLVFAQDVGMTALIRSRPLWTCQLVAMAGGRAAIVFHTHHCLMDGAGMVTLLTNMHSDSAEPSPNKPAPAPSAQLGAVDPLSMSVDDIAREVKVAPNRLWKLAGYASRALTSPEKPLEFFSSIRRVLSTPAGSGSSPLFARREGKDWRFGAVECPLDELKAAGRAVGGSVNDAYLAALLGGVRRYHHAKHLDIGDIVMAMPVSVRRPGDPPGGNRFAGTMIAGPAGEEDPAERIAIIRGSVLSVRAEPAIEVLGMLSPVLNRIPAALLNRVVDLAPSADLSASNVPGLAHQVFAAGAKVERMFVFAALPHVSMMCAMISYAGTCCLGINADGAVYDDTELLWASMRAGFDEVLDLGRQGGVSNAADE